MRKMVLYAACVAVICVTAFYVLYLSNHDTKKNLKFLKEYGWVAEEDVVEIEEIIIPEVFDDVYNNYNDLQKQADLSLDAYKGKKAVRYTYRIKNYPNESGEVRANVVCVKGKPVAGDIMTVRLDGFMHSLMYPK